MSDVWMRRRRLGSAQRSISEAALGRNILLSYILSALPTEEVSSQKVNPVQCSKLGFSHYRRHVTGAPARGPRPARRSGGHSRVPATALSSHSQPSNSDCRMQFANDTEENKIRRSPLSREALGVSKYFIHDIEAYEESAFCRGTRSAVAEGARRCGRIAFRATGRRPRTALGRSFRQKYGTLP
ncbi:hypothetical protein EVAR_61072_1 [Eumeta japonica]|uniref:Uncharacterized protein n=1 Tax=Eumeta variegata TaxID=151549 RepID=A0A4C1Z722_EUMVA|nr:hypothetical protein EVAR_61072_1 [Eumeta japonica]